MTKRLQVILPEAEYREALRAARAQNMTLAAWVRQALVAARRREPQGDLRGKLDAVRTAAQFSYPTGDIDALLSAIERGYGVADSQ